MFANYIFGYTLTSSPKVNELRLDIFSLQRLILGLRPANERRRYKVTPSLIGWAQISPDYHVTIRHVTRTPVCPIVQPLTCIWLYFKFYYFWFHSLPDFSVDHGIRYLQEIFLECKQIISSHDISLIFLSYHIWYISLIFWVVLYCVGIVSPSTHSPIVHMIFTSSYYWIWTKLCGSKPNMCSFIKS